jgi:hypothetical protein
MSQHESISSRISPWTMLGFACLVATLLLTSPGVRVVRADEPNAAFVPLVSEAPPAQTCDAAGGQAPVTPSSVQQQVAGQAQVATSLEEAQGGFLMLNSRGYNYGPATASPDR